MALGVTTVLVWGCVSVLRYLCGFYWESAKKFLFVMRFGSSCVYEKKFVF